MAEAPLCPVSGQPMVRDVRSKTIRYRGLSSTVLLPGWYCDASGESIHSKADLKVSDRALNAMKAELSHLAGPNEIMRIRRGLKLSQAEAGRVLGGGPRAFQKYEKGDVVVSRGMSNLLRMASRHPEEVRQMAAEADAADRQQA